VARDDARCRARRQGRVGALLAGWGFFIRCNRLAEELEPEAMRQAKKEDKKLE
jgi:hypothetical protein